jgi:hypothetical protein
MGIVYVAAGIIAWRSVDQGKYASATIFLLNFVVLGTIYYLYTVGGTVAVDSLRAMILRTVVWFALFIGFAWMSRRNHLAGFKRNAGPVGRADSP